MVFVELTATRRQRRWRPVVTCLAAGALIVCLTACGSTAARRPSTTTTTTSSSAVTSHANGVQGSRTGARARRARARRAGGRHTSASHRTASGRRVHGTGAALASALHALDVRCGAVRQGVDPAAFLAGHGARGASRALVTAVAARARALQTLVDDTVTRSAAAVKAQLRRRTDPLVASLAALDARTAQDAGAPPTAPITVPLRSAALEVDAAAGATRLPACGILAA